MLQLLHLDAPSAPHVAVAAPVSTDTYSAAAAVGSTDRVPPLLPNQVGHNTSAPSCSGTLGASSERTPSGTTQTTVTSTDEPPSTPAAHARPGRVADGYCRHGATWSDATCSCTFSSHTSLHSDGCSCSVCRACEALSTDCSCTECMRDAIAARRARSDSQTYTSTGSLGSCGCTCTCSMCMGTHTTASSSSTGSAADGGPAQPAVDDEGFGDAFDFDAWTGGAPVASEQASTENKDTEPPVAAAPVQPAPAVEARPLMVVGAIPVGVDSGLQTDAAATSATACATDHVETSAKDSQTDSASSGVLHLSVVWGMLSGLLVDEEGRQRGTIAADADDEYALLRDMASATSAALMTARFKQEELRNELAAEHLRAAEHVATVQRDIHLHAAVAELISAEAIARQDTVATETAVVLGMQRKFTSEFVRLTRAAIASATAKQKVAEKRLEQQVREAADAADAHSTKEAELRHKLQRSLAAAGTIRDAHDVLGVRHGHVRSGSNMTAASGLGVPSPSAFAVSASTVFGHTSREAAPGGSLSGTTVLISAGDGDPLSPTLRTPPPEDAGAAQLASPDGGPDRDVSPVLRSMRTHTLPVDPMGHTQQTHRSSHAGEGHNYAHGRCQHTLASLSRSALRDSVVERFSRAQALAAASLHADRATAFGHPQ